MDNKFRTQSGKVPSRHLIEKIRPFLKASTPLLVRNPVSLLELDIGKVVFQNFFSIFVLNSDKYPFFCSYGTSGMTTFPKSNFNYETRFRTIRGVLAIQKWS